MVYRKLETGKTYWQKRRVIMGNTTMRRDAWYQVRIIELYPDKTSALVSWNGNPARVWAERDLKTLRATRPETKPSIFG